MQGRLAKSSSFLRAHSLSDDLNLSPPFGLVSPEEQPHPHGPVGDHSYYSKCSLTQLG